jgi:hypothetical protein
MLMRSKSRTPLRRLVDFLLGLALLAALIVIARHAAAR